MTTLVLALCMAADPPKPNTLTAKELADGWLLLFDGETTFGWQTSGAVTAKDGWLTVPAAQEKKTFAKISELPKGTMRGVESGSVSPTASEWELTGPNGAWTLWPGWPAERRWQSIKYKPAGLEPLFNGKDLSGWKAFAGNPKQSASKFEVTKTGELHVVNGPGDLQTEKAFADFLLQLDCKTNGAGLNSGVFLRCLPGQYQQGYEAQISNAIVKGDRAKPLDFGTGAIYRRQPARKVVSDDNEWFTLTVLAVGPRLRTWVNGYPVADWTDDRPANDNARQGKKLTAGPISLQGHDPTTDLLFRNIRVVEVK